MHSRDQELDEHNPSEAQFRRVHLAWKLSWASQNFYELYYLQGTVEFLNTVNDLGVIMYNNRQSYFHEGPHSTLSCTLDRPDRRDRSQLPEMVIRCPGQRITISGSWDLSGARCQWTPGVLLDSGSCLHHQQDWLLQQSPGGSQQISGEHATINFACSWPPAHEEKKVRYNFRRHPTSIGFQLSKGSGSRLVCWSTVVFTRECSILLIGNANCSGGCHWLIVNHFGQLTVETWSFLAL